MKIRADVIRMYRDVHGWVGIISGLALFIAFYAGAITMFEAPLQRWASPPQHGLPPAPSLARAPELVAKLLKAHPEAARGYDVHILLGPQQPARVSWRSGDDRDHATVRHAALDGSGNLVVTDDGPSAVAQFIDILHQQVGLPLDHEFAMPIMGVIALLYAMALVSGTIVLLPSLIKDLFAVRLGQNLKRMWLDVHNVLGLFSLPFHLVIAFSSVVFAFHDQFYAAQALASRPPAARPQADRAGNDTPPMLAPADAVRALRAQAPGFEPITLSYGDGPRGRTIRVQGRDPRYPMRGADFGVAALDPHSGAIISADYLPGHQSGTFAVLSSFFALHFGNYGGAPVRWGYFVLGLAGAALFYTGNLLWIERRRTRERKAGAVVQTRSTRILAALSLGMSLGCVAGISVTLVAAKVLPLLAVPATSWHAPIYYTVFLAMSGWALVRGAARSGGELLTAVAVTYLAIPFVSALSLAGLGWHHGASDWLVDLAAIIGAASSALMARHAFRRAGRPPLDSVWSRAPA